MIKEIKSCCVEYYKYKNESLDRITFDSTRVNFDDKVSFLEVVMFSFPYGKLRDIINNIQS